MKIFAKCSTPLLERILEMADPNITGYYTLRRDLMVLANEFNAKRLELIEIQKKISEGITLLVNAIS